MKSTNGSKKIRNDKKPDNIHKFIEDFLIEKYGVEGWISFYKNQSKESKNFPDLKILIDEIEKLEISKEIEYLKIFESNNSELEIKERIALRIFARLLHLSAKEKDYVLTYFKFKCNYENFEFGHEKLINDIFQNKYLNEIGESLFYFNLHIHFFRLDIHTSLLKIIYNCFENEFRNDIKYSLESDKEISIQEACSISKEIIEYEIENILKNYLLKRLSRKNGTEDMYKSILNSCLSLKLSQSFDATLFDENYDYLNEGVKLDIFEHDWTKNDLIVAFCYSIMFHTNLNLKFLVYEFAFPIHLMFHSHHENSLRFNPSNKIDYIHAIVDKLAINTEFEIKAGRDISTKFINWKNFMPWIEYKNLTEDNNFSNERVSLTFIYILQKLENFSNNRTIKEFFEYKNHSKTLDIVKNCLDAIENVKFYENEELVGLFKNLRSVVC
jgi:hypothetical protein